MSCDICEVVSDADHFLAGMHFGTKPNSHNLSIFWSCLQVGHANNLVGLDGAQSKHTLTDTGRGGLHTLAILLVLTNRSPVTAMVIG